MVVGTHFDASSLFSTGHFIVAAIHESLMTRVVPCLHLLVVPCLHLLLIVNSKWKLFGFSRVRYRAQLFCWVWVGELF
jgi:hypothetical protein